MRHPEAIVLLLRCGRVSRPAQKFGSPAEFMGEIGVSLIVLSLWIYGQHKRCCPQIHRRNNKRKSLESEIEGAIVDVRKN